MGSSAKWPQIVHEVCSKEGHTEVWHRTAPRIPDLEKWMGKECTATTLRDSGGTDRNVYRCWNSCSGRSTPDAGWKQYGSSGIYTDIDTSSCDASANPIVLTSLGGNREQWSSMGVTSIYSPTTDGFRVYVNKSGITVDDAEDWD